jgi:N-acetylglucosamine kinase-like BadF-type ATPase
MCGASTDADFEHLKGMFLAAPELPSDLPVTVVNDTYSGLSGGLSGRPGIVLIAGTGSAVFGRNAAGETYLCGGWGALVDDCGSAYWVGLEALKIVARAADARAKPTALTNVVFRFFGINETRQLISCVHNEGLERSGLALLAPDVVMASSEGDWAAKNIVARAIEELVTCVKTVADKLFADDSDCSVVLVGGLALSGEPFQRMLIEAIERAVPSSKVCDAELPPERGAALEALRFAGIELTPTILANLKATNVG